MEGLDTSNYKLEFMMYPMWWVSGEGALLLAGLSILFFLSYAICCPARAGECSLNIHDAPTRGTSALLACGTSRPLSEFVQCEVQMPNTDTNRNADADADANANEFIGS